MNTGTVLKGAIIGLIIPFVGYAVELMLIDWFISSPRPAQETFRVRTLILVAICLNLIPFHFFRYRRETKSMQGTLMVTVGLAILWLFYFGYTLLS